MLTHKTQNHRFGGKPNTRVSGILELHHKGYGFLRNPNNLLRKPDDAFVSEAMIKRYSLRSSAYVTGDLKSSGANRSPKLIRVETADGRKANRGSAPHFDELTPTNPKKWLRLERSGPESTQPIAMRVLDLLTPIGLGQRALIASPPRAGKTTLLKQIARSIGKNHPDISIKMLLIDERPEEVTDMREEQLGEVFASNLDHDPKSHARLSQLVIDRCQRIAESGKDVFLLVDSLTRMARAFNKLPSSSGAIGAGGLNIHALDVPKRIFASARPFAEGGSLTIVASVLVDTSNRMDEVIFREFKGTGNLDIVLDQQLADRRVWPAVDIAQSATRRVELLHDVDTLNATTALRNSLLTMPRVEAMQQLTDKLQRFSSNAEFVRLINQSR